jgi:hypothetical protein
MATAALTPTDEQQRIARAVVALRQVEDCQHAAPAATRAVEACRELLELHQAPSSAHTAHLSLVGGS